MCACTQRVSSICGHTRREQFCKSCLPHTVRRNTESTGFSYRRLAMRLEQCRREENNCKHSCTWIGIETGGHFSQLAQPQSWHRRALHPPRGARRQRLFACENSIFFETDRPSPHQHQPKCCPFCSSSATSSPTFWPRPLRPRSRNCEHSCLSMYCTGLFVQRD